MYVRSRSPLQSCMLAGHLSITTSVVYSQNGIPYNSKFRRSKTSLIEFLAAPIDMPIGLNIFLDTIFVIHLHLKKITKFIDHENLELYGTRPPQPEWHAKPPLYNSHLIGVDRFHPWTSVT